MALTDSAIKTAKPKVGQYKLHDEKGPLPIVRPTGGKLWRLKYNLEVRRALDVNATGRNYLPERCEITTDRAMLNLPLGPHPAIG